MQARVPFRGKRKAVQSRKKKAFVPRAPSSHNRTTTWVNRASIKDHTIVDDRMLTKVSCSFTGDIGSATTFAPGQFILYGNSFFEPFTVPSNGITTVVTAQNGSTIARPPMGYATLSSLYNQYRVRSSAIKVTVQPTNSTADAPLVVVFPSVGVFSSATGNPYQTQNQRYSKWKQCTLNNNVAMNTITNYMSSAKVLGFTKQQYDDYPATVVSSAPSTAFDWFWQVAIYNAIGGNFTGNVIVTVELSMYVELSDPLGLTG